MDGSRSSADHIHFRRVAPKSGAMFPQHRSGRQAKSALALAGGVNRRQVVAGCLRRSQCTSPGSASKGSRPRWELWQQLGRPTARKSTGVARKRLIAHNAARQHFVTRYRGERSSPRTPPSRCSRCRFRAPTSSPSRRGEPSSVPPAIGESAPRGAECTGSGAPGRTCGTPQGQTEIISCSRRRCDPSHGNSVATGSERLEQDQHADLQNEVNAGNSLKGLELTSYGLRGVRVWEASRAAHPARSCSTTFGQYQRRAYAVQWQNCR